jgi:hypothetical protein
MRCNQMVFLEIRVNRISRHLRYLPKSEIEIAEAQFVAFHHASKVFTVDS